MIIFKNKNKLFILFPNYIMKQIISEFSLDA